jgi:hypothetical protein
MVASKAPWSAVALSVSTNWYDPGVRLDGSTATTAVEVYRSTSSGIPSIVTPGVVVPKFLPVMVMVGGLIE